MISFSGLTNDVFISYAHSDNTEEWVDRFHERLHNKLRQLDRRAPFTIWRDPKLTGADVFTEEIDRQIKSSGILISILSPNGLDSSWCQQERQRFQRAANSTGGLRLGTKMRAIRVTKAPCDGDRDRQIFGTLGYEFYVRSQTSGRFSQFHPESPEFDALVLDLAQEVYALLQELRGRLLSRSSDLRVYVAPGHSDFDHWLTRITDQLTGLNCQILPDARPSTNFSAGAIQDSLTGCLFSVHLVGPKRGLIPQDEELPIELLQITYARSAGIDRIICQIGEPHADWPDLAKPQGLRGNEDLVRSTTPDDLLQILEDRIGSLRKVATSAAGDLPIVYVICSPSEWDDALSLKSCLESEQGCAAMLPIRDVNDTSVRLRDHRETLKTCQSVLVYWGAKSPASWFREQQREVIGARKKRRTRVLPALFLSSSPCADPAADALPGLPFHQVSSLDCSDVRRFFRYLAIGSANGGTK